MLGVGCKGKREKGDEETLVLGWEGVLAILLASVVPFAGESVTVRTELAYFFCQLRRDALVYF